MKCKVNNKNCLNGQIWEEGRFISRCECKRIEFVEFYYRWSEAPEKLKKELKEIKDKEIYVNAKLKNAVSYKDEVKILVENKDDLIQSNAKILLQGIPGSGKTQFSLTLALEILKTMDLTKSEMKYDAFYFFPIKKLISERKIFDNDFVGRVWEKVKFANVLIVDDLGEELDILKRNSNDKRVFEVLDLLKTILDTFEGLTIMTTNNPKFEEMYKEEHARLHSRLFGEEGENDNLLYYAIIGDDERDKQASKTVSFLKNRFN